MPKKTATPYLTSKESIALKLIFGWFNESQFNRTWDEYRSIAARLPKLEALHAYVNECLAKMAAANYSPFEICYARAGDRQHWYEPFPTSLSRETVRLALVKSGMWQLRQEALASH